MKSSKYYFKRGQEVDRSSLVQGSCSQLRTSIGINPKISHQKLQEKIDNSFRMKTLQRKQASILPTSTDIVIQRNPAQTKYNLSYIEKQIDGYNERINKLLDISLDDVVEDQLGEFFREVATFQAEVLVDVHGLKSIDANRIIDKFAIVLEKIANLLQRKESKFEFASMPVDMQKDVMGFLDLKDLMTMSHVNKSTQKIINNDGNLSKKKGDYIKSKDTIGIRFIEDSLDAAIDYIDNCNIISKDKLLDIHLEIGQLIEEVNEKYKCRLISEASYNRIIEQANLILVRTSSLWESLYYKP